MQTPASERVKGTVQLIESYTDKKTALTRVWVATGERMYVLQCPEYHAVRDLKSPDTLSLTDKVLGQEDGVRIYDGREICERLK